MTLNHILGLSLPCALVGCSMVGQSPWAEADALGLSSPAGKPCKDCSPHHSGEAALRLESPCSTDWQNPWPLEWAASWIFDDHMCTMKTLNWLISKSLSSQAIFAYFHLYPALWRRLCLNQHQFQHENAPPLGQWRSWVRSRLVSQSEFWKPWNSWCDVMGC